MGFVDFPEKKESEKPKLKMQHTQNGTYAKRKAYTGVPRVVKILHNVKKATKHSTTSLPIPLSSNNRSIAGIKFTKTQQKRVDKYRANVGKKNKKIAKSIWRKLF